MRRSLFLLLLLFAFAGINPLFADGVTIETATEEIDPDNGRSVPQDEARYFLDLDAATFASVNASYNNEGRYLVDIDVRWTGSAERYSAIWYPVNGTIHTLIQGTTSDWTDFFTAMNPLNGRYLDVEVGYFGSDKRYSAIFFENGDDYGSALRTTNDDTTFQSYLEQYLNAGLSIIDFEAYTEPDGDVRYAGIWVSDPNQPQTVLYYGLESADVSDLIAPRNGRVIDIEYYYSELHDEYRWAMIFAMDSGGEQFQRRGDTAASIDSYDDSFTDSNTEIIDIESYNTSSGVRYSALWGDTYKSLHEVALIPSDSDAETIPAASNNLLTTFENAGNDTIGLYAKNVRSNQSWAYRANEPFYLASTAKIAVHIKLWREIQNGHLTAAQTIPFTNGANQRDPWYVEDRNFPGFSSANFGLLYPLSRFDQAMMGVSDNAATSALVDSPTIGLMQDNYDLNEWLADVDGVGQGWGPVTSIHDVDRTILWQGQQNADDAAECSYFTIPGWAFEPRWRSGSDTYGDLDNWLDANASNCERNDIPDGQAGWGNALPEYLSTDGHYRYYNMGLNTATPKATVSLLEKLVQGDLLDEATTATAISTFGEGTVFDNDPNWPSHVDVYAKGGVKGGDSDPVSDAAIFDLGPDALVVGVFTENNSRTTSTIRNNFTNPLGYDMLTGLAADLQSCYASYFTSSNTLYAGQQLRFLCFMENDGGGDASAFEVDFYASTNTIISTADYLLDTVSVSSLAGNLAKQVTLDITLPNDLPVGDYYLGWIIDPIASCFSADSSDCRNVAGNVSFGNVGEYDEGNNNGYDTNELLTVTNIPTAVQLRTTDTSTHVPPALLLLTALAILSGCHIYKRQV